MDTSDIGMKLGHYFSVKNKMISGKETKNLKSKKTTG